MKNQLLNLKMIALMCLMMVLGGANVWAQDAQTIFLETFGANNAKKGTAIDSYSGYSATDVMFVTGNAKSNYSGDGKIGGKNKEPSKDYEGASGESNCFYSTTKENVNKEVTIIKISNIKIEGYNNLQLSFGEMFSAITQTLTVKYQIDGGEEKTLISGKPSQTKWLLKTLDIPSQGKSLTLTFVHKATLQSHITRLDDIKVTGVKAAAGPTYTAQTLTFIAQDDESYYATFSSDKVTFFPIVQVIPYAITVANGKITEKSNMFESKVASTGSETISGYYIPANTGIMLYSTASNVNYYTVENYTVDDLAEGANMLMPSVAGGKFTAETGKVYYKLAYGDWTNKTQLGFYWGADNGGAFYVKAGTAYLAVPEANTASAKGFAFNGEATGIEGVNANVENAKAIYNLNGQRVASMAKPGLYIVNGKKVVRK